MEAVQCGEIVFQVELESDVQAPLYPMALNCRGTQVACCMEKVKAVSLRDVATGEEAHKLTGPFEGQLAGVSYSADGKLVLVFGDWGTKVYDAASGSLVHSFVDKTAGDGTGTTVFHSAVAGELFFNLGTPTAQRCCGRRAFL